MRRTPVQALVLFPVLVAVLALGACAPGPASGSVPIAKALADARLDAETRRFLEGAAATAEFLAARFGLEKGSAALRFLPEAREAPAWRLVSVGEGEAAHPGFSWYASLAEAEAAAARAAAKGASIRVEPVDSLVGSGKAPGPLVTGQANRSQADLAEQVALRVFHEALRGVRDARERDALSLFLAEKATILYLGEKLTPASPVLGAYIAEKRDGRTFQSLLEGLRERFANVLAQEATPEDRNRSLDFQVRAWLDDFRFSYRQRFITGRYQDFGADGVDEALLAAHADPVPRYGEWEAEYRRLGEDAAAFYGKVARSIR